MNPTTESDPITPLPNTPAVTFGSEDPRRAKRDLTELLEAAARILPEYAGKLSRFVDSALNIWDQRVPQGAKYMKDTKGAVEHELDSFLRVAISRLGDEFLALSEPLRWWITKLSAVHEEGRLTEVQRMELRLRLSELESKFQTAGRLLKQLNVLGPSSPVGP